MCGTVSVFNVSSVYVSTEACFRSFFPIQNISHRPSSRLSLYFAISSFAGAFSGLLAAAIIKLDGRGGRPGWAWILILVYHLNLPLTVSKPLKQEGLLTILFGMISVFFLPASVERARFFNAEEKEYLINTLRRDGIVARNPAHDKFRWKTVTTTFKRPHLMSMALACFFGGTTQIGLA